MTVAVGLVLGVIFLLIVWRVACALDDAHQRTMQAFRDWHDAIRRSGR